MEVFDQISPQAMLFLMLYGGAAVAAAIACLYLLLSKGNAFAPGNMPPVRLRRWAAALFGMTVLSHCYWFLYYVFPNDMRSVNYVLFSVLDSVILLITLPCTLLAMLQDRRRPLWPFVVATVPIVVLGALQISQPDADYMTSLIFYVLSAYTLFTIYMVRAAIQYKQWLRENYADMEHKEVWVTHILGFVFLLLFFNYGYTNDDPSSFLVRFSNFLLIGLLLWRVETLRNLRPSLTPEASPKGEESSPCEEGSSTYEERSSQRTIPANIGQLLEKHCEETMLYLQHDLSLAQLSEAVGINRYYLSMYFANQGTNYSNYIHQLRIEHFVARWRKTAGKQQNITAQQLARESGYHSYSTFSAAFKQRMGQSVSAWIRSLSEE